MRVDRISAPVLAYHERSKNRPGHPAAAPAGLNRATEPVPFRRYLGAELLPLPEVPPQGGPAWNDLFVPGAVPPAVVDRQGVGQLFYDALAISAWREEGGARFSFRVNPSAGNLHPTEAYLLAGPITDLSERPALYHYSPFDHGLEVRAELPEGLVPSGSLLVGFSTILWRTAWKYGERAFRLAHLDAGHAMAALAYAAAALGWEVRRVDLADEALARLLGIQSQEGPERERPVTLVEVRTSKGPSPSWTTLERPIGAEVGRPNRISPGHRSWPILDEIAETTRVFDSATPASCRVGFGRVVGWGTRPAETGNVPARVILHGRRSAAGFSGKTAAEDFSPFLPGGLPLSTAGAVRLEWLIPWQSLDLVRLAGGQAFVSDASRVAVILGDLELAAEHAWQYRRLHWDAGALGHVLSLESSARGWGARGIGGFLDDEVLSALGLPVDGRWQALYLLAIGGGE